jgi:hypothetical protein
MKKEREKEFLDVLNKIRKLSKKIDDDCEDNLARLDDLA